MNFVFFGSPNFASIILEKLVKAGFIPAAVVCNPDKPVGRKKIITPPAVKSLILKHSSWNMDILQPENLDSDFQFQVSGFKPDVFIVAAYAKILPKEIIAIPKMGAIGVHPSLLPKHRGSAPIQNQILQGDKTGGTTLFLIDEKMDNGPILSQKEIAIENQNYEELEKELADLSAELLIETLPKFLEKKITPQKQNSSFATYTKKFTSQDGFIEFADLEKAQKGGEIAIKIGRKIRALNPEPGVWTIYQNKRVKILKAEISAEGKLKLITIQWEGKKPTPAENLAA